MTSNSVDPREAPIIADLASIGFDAPSIAALRTSRTRYSAAIPVLLRWLTNIDEPELKDAIVRALSVPWARPIATKPLLHEFRMLDDSADPSGMGLRWTIGNSLEVLFDDAHLDDYADIARDPHFGRSREMVVLALGKSKRADAVPVLLSLVDDPEVDGHAIKALAKIAAPDARDAFLAKLDDRRAWVRNAARKGLTKIPI